MSFHHRVYVYGEQQQAAQAMLDQCYLFPSGRLQRVSYREHLMGLDCGTFLVITGHAKPVPAEIMAEVEHIGMVVFELNDGFARARAARRYSARTTDAA